MNGKRACLISSFLCGAAACGTNPAPHAPFPVVSAHRGDVLSPLTLVSIIVEGDDQADALRSFGDKLIASKWWWSLSAEFGLDPKARHVVVSAPLAGFPVEDSPGGYSEHALFRYVSSVLNVMHGPAPDGNTVYVLYLPPGSTLSSSQGSNDHCQRFGGYHVRFGTRGDNLSLVQRCASGGELTATDMTTLIGSHEIVESVTDPTGVGWTVGYPSRPPWNGSVWAASATRHEVGDLCEESFWLEDGFVYQRFYGPSAAAKGVDPCVPATSLPYFSVSTEHDWYALDANTGRVEIPLSAWATGDYRPWPVRATFESAGAASRFEASLESPVTAFNASAGGAEPEAIAAGRNGLSLTLKVKLLVDAVSGQSGIIHLESLGRDARGYALPRGQDYTHTWLVGVYVP